MTNKPLIAGNWKLNKTIKEAVELVTLLKRKVSDVHNVDIVVCPPYTALASLADVLLDSNIALGAQDVYWEEKGAFTGEVSSTLLKDAGAKYVVIGHSERRQFFNETNETVQKKTVAALKSALTPIVCVGETLAEREAGKTFQVIELQLKGAYKDLTKEQFAQTVIAYEPVWAIGTGKVATPAQAQEVHEFIRREMSKRFDGESSKSVRLLYGGSVKPDNISSLLAQPDIDGALVGGASLEAEGFAQMVQSASLVSVK